MIVFVGAGRRNICPFQRKRHLVNRARGLQGELYEHLAKTLIIGTAGAGGGCLGIFLTWLVALKIPSAYFWVGGIFFVIFWIPFGLLFCLFFSNLAGQIVDSYD